MRVLLIGDTHVSGENLEESKSLCNLIYETTLKQKPDLVCFLGDDLDGFTYPSVLAQSYLTDEIFYLARICHVVILLGNHSISPNNPNSHSLLPLKFLDNVTVVDHPLSKFGFDFMPYRKNQEQFTEEANKLSNNVLFCHQDFNGCEYENGWFSKDGAEPDDLKHKKVISGHIHKAGYVDKVWYPGSPRWLKKSDANEDKNLYLLNSETDEIIKIPTWPSVTKFKALELTEDDQIPELDEINTKYFVTLKGSFEFCKKVSEELESKAEIKTVLTRQRKQIIKQQSNVELSINEYLNKYEPQFGVKKEDLIKEINERLK